MATNDNLLGAPTSGLGQAVDYTYDTEVSKGMPTLRFQQVEQVVAGHTGGTSRTAHVEGYQPIKADTGLITAISKVAGGFIDGKVKAAQQNAFIEGQQTAMQGKAIDEIIEEQPWFSKTFGFGADVIEGARQWTAADRANRLATQIEQRMDIWKTYDPSTAAREYSSAMDSVKTGDDATDRAISAQVLKQYPGLMKAQSKAHWGYLQDNASKAWENAYSSVAARVQAAGASYAAGTTSDADMEALKADALATVMPVPGMDEENYKRSLSANAVVSAKRGDLFMLNALTDAGMLNALSPEQRLAVEQAQVAGHNKVHGTYSKERVNGLSAFMATLAKPYDGYTIEKAHATIDQINTDFKRATGSKEDYFPVDKSISDLASLNVKIQNSQYERADALRKRAEREGRAAQTQSDKDAAAFEKEQAEKREHDTTVFNILRGRVGTALSQPGLSEDKVNNLFASMFNDARIGRLTGDGGKPVSPQSLLMSNYYDNGKAVRPVADMLRGSIAPFSDSKAWGPGFDAINTEYQALREQSEGAAAAYYGDFAKNLNRYEYALNQQRALNGGRELDANQKTTAFHSAFVAPPPQLSQTKEETDAFRKGLGDTVRQTKWYGGDEYDLRPGMERFIVDAVADDAKQYQTYDPSGSREKASQYALAGARANGLEVYGGLAWRRRRGEPEWHTALKLPDGKPAVDNAADAAKWTASVIDAKLADPGRRIDPKADVQVFREQRNGEAVLLVQASGIGNEPAQWFTIRPADIVNARMTALMPRAPGKVSVAEQKQIDESTRRDAQRNPLVSDSIEQTRRQLQ